MGHLHETVVPFIQKANAPFFRRPSGRFLLLYGVCLCVSNIIHPGRLIAFQVLSSPFAAYVLRGGMAMAKQTIRKQAILLTLTNTLVRAMGFLMRVLFS